jgi:hypothetical protein
MFQWLQNLLEIAIPSGILVKQRYANLQQDLNELRVAEMWITVWLDTNKGSPHFQEMTGIKNTFSERVARLGETIDHLGDTLQKIEFEEAMRRLQAKRLSESTWIESEWI